MQWIHPSISLVILTALAALSACTLGQLDKTDSAPPPVVASTPEATGLPHIETIELQPVPSGVVIKDWTPEELQKLGQQTPDPSSFTGPLSITHGSYTDLSKAKTFTPEQVEALRQRPPMRTIPLVLPGSAGLTMTVTWTPTPQPGSWPPPHIAEAIATAQADPRPKPPKAYNPPSPKPDPTLRPGILEVRQGPWSTQEFSVSNKWSGQIGAEWLIVYAGIRHLPLPVQGELRIHSAPRDQYGRIEIREIGKFSAPVGSDPLTITAVDGVIMRLRTDGGKTLSFNLQTRQYQ